MLKVVATAINPALYIGLIVTALFMAMPLLPTMPVPGLDASWKYAINQAVADRLSFGREVIFTYGPYGALYTRGFHPATDELLMWTGLFFGLCLGAVAVLLARRSLW